MNGYALTIFFMGIFSLATGTISRYILRLGLPINWYRKLFTSLSPVNLKVKNMEVFMFLVQVTALLWILLGLGYGFVVANFNLAKWFDDLLSLVVGFGPAFLLGGAANWLKTKYWL